MQGRSRLRLTRRELFAAALFGGAGIAGALASRRRGARVPTDGADLEALVDVIAGSTQASVLETITALLARRVSVERLLAAAFLAPILTAGDDEDLHALLVIPSVRAHFAERGRDRDGLLPVYWAIANAQRWCKAGRRAPGALGELMHRDLDALLAELRLQASRRRQDPDPHGAIFAAQATRALPWLDRPHALEVVQSVARHFARWGQPPLASQPIRLDETSTTPAPEIAAALMAAPATGLDGLSSAAIWQALCLIAVDTRLADGYTSNATGGLALHQTTLLDALWLIHDRAEPVDRPAILGDTVRRVLDLRRVIGVSGEVAPPAAFTQALSRAQADLLGFVETLRSEVAAKGNGEHDFKLFGAVEAIAAKLPSDVRARWWAAAALAHPIGSRQCWDRADEARALIAGLL